MGIMPTGTRLRVPELLEERHMTPMDLVRVAHIASGTAYRLAKGDYEALNMDIIRRVKDALGVTYDELFEDIGKPAAG